MGFFRDKEGRKRAIEKIREGIEALKQYAPDLPSAVMAGIEREYEQLQRKYRDVYERRGE
jgi:hypothetical protein